MTARVARVARALFAEAFDYAGLFPPASLDLSTVARNYDAHRRGRSAWMLGRLVLPAARLDEFRTAAAPWLPPGEGVVPWRIAAVLGDDVGGDLARVERFNNSGRAGSSCPATVDTVEVRVASREDVERLADVVPPGIVVACEVPDVEGRPALLQRVAAHRFVAKVRVGGVVAEAFPSAASLAAFLRAATACGARLKATAGLHHAVRGEYPMTYEPDAASTTMHGYLNLFMAVAACRRAACDVNHVVDILERRSAGDLQVREDAITWRDLTVTTTAAEDVRAHVAITIGTCSFEEPVSELKALGMLGR